MLRTVMPTLNEAGGVVEYIERLTRTLEGLQVYGEVIVSDSSTDRTPEIAAEHGVHVATPDRQESGRPPDTGGHREEAEKGVLTGMLVFGVGAAYLLAFAVRWVRSGFPSLPSSALDVVAMTAASGDRQ